MNLSVKRQNAITNLQNTCNFNDPCLEHWQDYLVSLLNAHEEPEVIASALIPFCHYLTEREPFLPDSKQGKKIIKTFTDIAQHIAPENYVEGLLLIFRLNLSMSPEMNKCISNDLRSHYCPSVLASAIIFGLDKQLIFNSSPHASCNYTKLKNNAQIWFIDERLTSSFSRLIPALFTQKHFERLVFITASESDFDLKKLHLLCEMNLMLNPTANDLIEANATFLNLIAIAPHLLEYDETFFIPEMLAGAAFPRQVMINFVKMLNADLFCPSNTFSASNTLNLIRNASLWFDNDHISLKFFDLSNSDITQAFLDKLFKATSEIANYTRLYQKLNQLIDTRETHVVQPRTKTTSKLNPAAIYTKATSSSPVRLHTWRIAPSPIGIKTTIQAQNRRRSQTENDVDLMQEITPSFKKERRSSESDAHIETIISHNRR